MSHHQSYSVGERRVLAGLWKGIAIPSCGMVLGGAYLVTQGSVGVGLTIAASMSALAALAFNSAKAVMRNHDSPAQSQ